MVGRKPPSRKKKVLVVVGGIGPTKKSKVDVARRIEALCGNFDVTIVTAYSEECASLFRGARIIGIPQFRLSRGSAVFILWCWFMLPFIRSEVVYISEVYNAPAALTLFRKRVVCYGNTHPMQHILSQRKGWRNTSVLLSALYGLMLRLSLHKCDMIFAISPQLLTAFLQYGIRKDEVQLLETGVSLEDFHPPSTDNPVSSVPFIAVYHGTVSVERGLQVMIEGAHLLSRRRRDFRIRLVGCSAKQIESLGRELDYLAISDLFELLPTVHNSEIPKILWSANCGISLLEPNVYFSASPPLKVLEYMAAGLPVIANDLPTHNHYLKNRTDSIIVGYTPSSFADALDELMDDQSLRMHLSSNALRRSDAHSDSESVSRLIQYIHHDN